MRRHFLLLAAVLLWAVPAAAEEATHVPAADGSAGAAQSDGPSPDLEAAAAQADQAPQIDEAPEPVAGAPEQAPEPAGAPEPDPWLEEEYDTWPPDPAERDAVEGYNRQVFRFNEGVYRWVVDPVTKGFRFVIPQMGRDAIRRVFDNLKLPVVFVNDVLQLAPRQAGETLGRFLMNTTFGLGGILDPAADVGWPGHHTDFGQTLALYGTPSGSYFVIPIAGPSTVRDSFGMLVDVAFRPDLWLLGFGPWLIIDFAGGVATFDLEAERLEALRATSVDFYAALRAAYLMDRDAAIAHRIELVRGDGRLGSVGGYAPEDALESAVLGFLAE